MRTATIVSSGLCLLATLSALVGVSRLAAGSGDALYERAKALRALNERKHVDTHPAALRGNESVRASADSPHR